ncbi:MAG: deoxyribose-phosphate aldolase [Blautia sp.]|jgi:deoxyribose-phosphate aldolase
MDTKLILSHIDHTLLKAAASWAEIQTLCEEALQYHTASVCIPASYIKRIKETYPDLNICTVIGFPLGYSTTAAKVTEAEEAIKDGASEIDMVINIGDMKNKDYGKVLDEVKAIRRASEGHILKVIIETCYLTEEEKIKMCEIVTEAKADYIKTSTGFGTGGATMKDVLLFKKHIGPDVKIKAAGGVRTREDLENFLNAGCDRIGTSSAVKLLAQ